jgi:hypothetical protein
MSTLIDVVCNAQMPKRQVGDLWYIAKNEQYWTWENVADALRVLTGKSRAYHFKEDEVKTASRRIGRKRHDVG